MRTLGCIPRRLGCKNCKCGIHRGCLWSDPPGKHPSGAHYPYEYVHRDPVSDCPCIAQDDARIKKIHEDEIAAERAEKEAIKAANRKERSLHVRLEAIEKILWGRSFAGEVMSRRPKQVAFMPAKAKAKKVSKAKCPV